MAIVPRSVKGNQRKQLLLDRVELDDNGRVAARTDAAGHRTQYKYDALNRRCAVIYPDGTTKHFERDGDGNILRILDQDRRVIVHRFDPLGRLVERRIEPPDGEEAKVERFRYDGLGRIVAAIADGATTVRRYDSLSRLLEETQAGRVIRYGYDAAGNRTRLVYPGGREVHKTYDALRRVSEVRDRGNAPVAEYDYRSTGQLKRQKLGDTLEATFDYKPCQGCLREVVYRSARDGRIIEGSRYLYDVAGNRTQETQLHRGDNSGERYLYDSANRLVGVQYGVEELGDPRSTFEQEVRYDLSPVGTGDNGRFATQRGRQ
jgi:YD repeat-containing protein